MRNSLNVVPYNLGSKHYGLFFGGPQLPQAQEPKKLAVLPTLRYRASIKPPRHTIHWIYLLLNPGASDARTADISMLTKWASNSKGSASWIFPRRFTQPDVLMLTT
jgi:hypothetical protein